MGVAFYGWRTQAGRFGARSLARTAAIGAGVLATYLLLAHGAHAVLDGAVAPTLPPVSFAQRALLVLVPLVFAAVLLLQANLPAVARTRLGRALYVTLLYGGYLGAWLNRRVAHRSLVSA